MRARSSKYSTSSAISSRLSVAHKRFNSSSIIPLAPALVGPGFSGQVISQRATTLAKPHHPTAVLPMKNLFTVLFTALLVTGCAHDYKPPLAVASSYAYDVAGNADEVFKKAGAALIAEGYAIASADAELGLISTQRRQMPLTPADVDVGSTWGIDYMKDKRTATYVTATIQTSAGKAVIRTDIDAEYLPNDVAFGKRMKGTSKGTLEQRLAARLK